MIDELTGNPQAQAMSWLVEMEVVSNPNVLNAMVMNIAGAVKGVKDIQFVIDNQRKKLLIFVELKKWDEFFHKKRICEQLGEMFEQIFPSFEKRVTFDRVLLDRAIKIIKEQ